MNRTLTLLFGILCYVVFLGAFLYQVGFVAGFAVPKTIENGMVVPRPQAITTNVVLLGLF